MKFGKFRRVAVAAGNALARVADHFVIGLSVDPFAGFWLRMQHRFNDPDCPLCKEEDSMFKCDKCGQMYFDQDGAAACARAGCHRPPAPAEIVPAKLANDSSPSPDAAPAAPSLLAASLAESAAVLASAAASAGVKLPPPPAPPAAPVPTLGRIVLYRPRPGECRQWAVPEVDQYPAVVVRVWSPRCVNLSVLTDSPQPMHATSVEPGEIPGTWSWPPRV